MSSEKLSPNAKTELPASTSTSRHWTQNLRDSFRDTLSRLLSTPEPQSLSEWADENFYLSAESSSIVGPWVTLPYQKHILDVIGNDDVRVVTWMKSARVGYTKCICAAVGYFGEHRKRNQLLYQPTDSDAVDFVKDEIDPILRDVPVLKEQLLSDPEKRGRHNTATKKSFLGWILDIKGGKTARNYRRMTKDNVYYDELDGFEHDIDNEGDPVTLGDTRMETSSFSKSVRGSTPRIKGMSQIEESLDEANVIFHRFLPCPHCGHMQQLVWQQMKWENHDPSTANYECISCEVGITYDQYGEMDAAGVWCSVEVDENGAWADTGVRIVDGGTFVNEDGTVHPPIYHVGFHIWSAYSYFQIWSALVMDFLAAVAEQKKGKLKKLKTFTNTRLGESWEEEGETADENVLKRHREQYAAEVPDGVKLLTAAVDVQDDRLEIEILGWGLGEESWGVKYIRLYGDISKITIWNILEETLKEPYEGEGGLQYVVKLACIDSGGHYTDEVYKFCKRNRRKYIPIKGHSIMGQPVAKMPVKPNGRGLYLTMVGTDTAKELIYDRYKDAQRGPGYCHYPADEAMGYDDEYFEQATCETKVKRYKKGVQYFEWIKGNNIRNEALDIRVYNLAAIRLLQQHYGVRLKVKLASIPKKDETPVKQTADQPAINQIRRQKLKRPGRGGFVNRYRR